MGSVKFAESYISKSIYAHNLKLNNNIFSSSNFSLQMMSFLQFKTALIKSHISNMYWLYEILLLGMTAKE